jgi:4-diphosphocytidyl-2-C-methyl-D-erythritol kinase
MPPEHRPDRLTVFAPAKINLCLHVGDKRADGFHELESLVAFVDAGDVLQFERADDLSLTIEGPFADGLSIGDDNLVLKAAQLLSARTKSNPGARIALQKNLPVASGIGGGSADAAATLRGLVDLWGLNLSASELHLIAAELGSDVPVCIESAPAWMEGRGERVTPISGLPDCWLLLINPGISVSTAEVFRKLGRSSHPSLEGGSKSSLSGGEKKISGRGIVDAAPRPEKFALRSNISTRPQGAGGGHRCCFACRISKLDSKPS